MKTKIKRRGFVEKNRRRYRVYGIILLVCMVLSVCGIALAGTGRTTKITIKAENLTMVQGTQIPTLTAQVELELEGKEKQMLDRKNKFSVRDLVQQLKDGEGYTISCDTDGVTEGEYPIKVTLKPELQEKITGSWKNKIDIDTEDASLTVQNKYGSWENEKFRRTDGSYVTNDFIVFHGHTYYFDENGNMCTGWREIQESRYHFDENGSMTAGWYEEDTSKYYFDEDGKMHTGWLEENGEKYYFNSDGTMALGEVRLGIAVYTFDESGVLVSEKKELDPAKPMLALTFDDGPGENTMELLNALEQYRAHATFFMCGTSLSRTDIDVDAILKKMDEIGCDTSNHTMSHPKLDKLTAEQVAAEVQGVSDIISSHTGHGAASLRPPYGRGIHSDIVTQNVGLPMIHWSIDTQDWKTKSKEATVQAVLDQAKDGDIVLMHDIHEWSVEAAVELIPKLIDAGWQLVTVSEMAAARGVALEPGVTYFNFYPAN